MVLHARARAPVEVSTEEDDERDDDRHEDDQEHVGLDHA
jgi:hypothetical protein